jgi:hypothetical protein
LLGKTLFTTGFGSACRPLKAVTKADAIRNYGANKILFIEGGLDRTVISQLVACYRKLLT